MAGGLPQFPKKVGRIFLPQQIKMVTSRDEKAVVVLPSLKDLIDAAKSPNANTNSTYSNTSSPPNSNVPKYSPISVSTTPGYVETPSRANFEQLYEHFLKSYHQSQQPCKISDHIIKFNDPPTYQKKTFFAYDLYMIVVECGGIHTVTRGLTIAPKINQELDKL